MTILTQFVYEKMWRPTSDDDALKIIEEEIGDADPKGTLDYVKSAIKEGKTITVGECRFKSDMK
ncbi:MAG: hypothetical protein U9Q62_10345 [Campylobacterota bacterium]|nr:hypothetical protein [Campylobacterota bacterium]